MKTKYTFDEICESQDFEHGQEFVPKEKVTSCLEFISKALLAVESSGTIEYVRRSISEAIKQLNEK